MERKNSQSNSNRDGLLLRSEASTTSSEFVLQWGNRKKLRCMKVQAKEPNNPVHRVTSRVDRRSNNNNNSKDSISNQKTNNNSSFKSSFGYLNLRHRPASTSPRILRNTEGNSIGMRGHTNGVRGLASKATSTTNNTNTKNNNNTSHHHNENHHHHQGGGGSGSSEMAHKGGSLSGGGDAIVAVWPPKFVIGLTNKEKEEDFLAIKGSKLPQRPKKRAKFIQRTLNLVSPGTWLCDLTLDRYEVREKKVSKKRARGLKGMGNMESESE